jgi:hypothetical protein
MNNPNHSKADRRLYYLKKYNLTEEEYKPFKEGCIRRGITKPEDIKKELFEYRNKLGREHEYKPKKQTRKTQEDFINARLSMITN